MKQYAWTLMVFSILLAACGTSATPAPTQAPTALPPTPTATFTSTPQPTATATPTETATPMPGIGSRWTRPADGMVMVYVPAGAFEMGSKDGLMTETVVHTVTLDAFWIDLTEVTNGMYALCVQAGKCEPPLQADRYGSSQFIDYPVTYVTWDKANAYCAWAGTDSGDSVRLPSEAEWEKAARGEDGSTYPWGNADITCTLANFTAMVFYQDESIITTKDVPCTGNTAAVGSLPQGASPYGALDMAGNVAEWVADWFGDYPASAVSNPIGAAPGAYRLTRGGAWNDTPTSLRTFARMGVYPSLTQDNLGFRCTRTP
jgi:eukaryotic-like serine/threonine-protein kinase